MTTTAIATVPATPGELGFDPERYPEWRPGQRDIIQQLFDWYVHGDERFLLLEAPTGVGKSLIAAALQRMIQAYHQDEDSESHAVISTTTLNLQRQYVEDTLAGLPGVASAWGRSNYDCLILPPGTPASDGPCTNGYRCPSRGECTYYVQRDRAHFAPLAVLNTAFYLTCANYVQIPQDWIDPDRGATTLYAGADLAIHDETHLLERAVRNLVECQLNRKFFREALSIPLPATNEYGAWEEWIDLHYQSVAQLANTYRREARALAEQGRLPDDPIGKRAVQQQDTMNRITHRLLPTRPLIEQREHAVVFRPIWGKDFAPEYLHQHARKHLLMSATIIHPDYMAETLGISPGDWKYIEMPSPFAAMRRRIVYDPQLKLSAKTSAQDFAGLIRYMDSVLDGHVDQKGIIHSVSYDRAGMISNLSRHRDRIVTHGRGRGEKEKAIQSFLAGPEGSILVSPAVGVGEDFGRGDNCRWQVVMKYPIPYLGDPIVKARREENPSSLWYEADMAFVQAVGRGTRSADDYSVTYVFDSSAAWRFQHLPRTIQQAIVRV